MPITRDANYPPEMAQLMQAFNMAADGHEPLTVMNATLQMMAAAVGLMAKEQGIGLPDALAYVDNVAGVIKREVRENWQRTPNATDVPVRAS
jgi:hypothetical protein